MATTSLWRIKGEVSDAVKYIENPERQRRDSVFHRRQMFPHWLPMSAVRRRPTSANMSTASTVPRNTPSRRCRR